MSGCVFADMPDGGLLSCPVVSTPLGSVVNCTLTPQRQGAQVYARATDFSFAVAPSGGSGGAATFTPSVAFGNVLQWQYAASGGVSQPVSVTASPGGSAVSLTVTLSPSNSSVTCAASEVSVGQTTTCTIVPLSETGTVLYSVKGDFAPSVTGSSGSAGAVVEPFGNALTFTFTASATVTGVALVGSGLANTPTFRIVVVGAWT